MSNSGEGVTRAHTLESQVHTGAISHYFFHPESSAHTKLESHAHTSQFPGPHVHAEGESHSGGVGDENVRWHSFTGAAGG